VPRLLRFLFICTKIKAHVYVRHGLSLRCPLSLVKNPRTQRFGRLKSGERVESEIGV